VGFAVALYLRKVNLFGPAAISTASIIASLASAILLAVGGWLGGRLVYTFGAGVAKRDH
jgi:uncharacterized membrane protein